MITDYYSGHGYSFVEVLLAGLVVSLMVHGAPSWVEKLILRGRSVSKAHRRLLEWSVSMAGVVVCGLWFSIGQAKWLPAARELHQVSRLWAAGEHARALEKLQRVEEFGLPMPPGGSETELVDQ